MKYYEVIYETGSHSVMSGESDQEVRDALEVHHERAVNGMEGGPSGQPAERVKKVLIYDEHPGDYMAEGSMSADVALKELQTRLKGKDAVSVEELAAEVRQLSSAIDHDALNESRHNSQFKAKETGELSGSWSK